jgi:hypothetical protein
MKQHAKQQGGRSGSLAHLGNELCLRGVSLPDEVLRAAYEVVEYVLLVVYAAGVSPCDPELPATPGTAESES